MVKWIRCLKTELWVYTTFDNPDFTAAWLWSQSALDITAFKNLFNTQQWPYFCKYIRRKVEWGEGGKGTAASPKAYTYMLRIKRISSLAVHEYSSLQSTQIGQVRRGGEIKDEFIYINSWGEVKWSYSEFKDRATFRCFDYAQFYFSATFFCV